MNNTALSKISGKQNMLAFLLLWFLTFVLYFPTAKAGWTIDAVGWIYNLNHLSFSNFINTTQSSTQSLYQLYALDFFIFYKLWGLNVWMWSLSFITVHAINAWLIYTICKNLFADSQIKNGAVIALCGAVVFTLTPNISEVLIWKACFHYLQGFLFVLLIMLWTQKYQHQQQPRYVVGAVLVFFLSMFALEIFYLTPWFVLSLALYYRFALNYDKAIFRKTLLSIFLPLILLLGCYFLLLYAKYGFFRPHVNNVFSQRLTDYLSKPPKYLFHILALGRYFSYAAKERVSAFFGSAIVLIVFYSIVLLLILDGVTRFKKISASGRAVLLLSVWVIMTIAFLMPLPFPVTNLLVFYDRYTYFADGFIFVLLALLASQYLNKYVAFSLLVIFGCINIFFTEKVNRYWKHSAYITNRLLRELPPADNKIVLLLNLPENMNGVPMIGAQKESQYKMMCEVLNGAAPKNTVYDVASYNMQDDKDGAHITISNDSMIHVTLNKWGSWFWYEGHGAKSYENADYKCTIMDYPVNHWYVLTLKKPASQYLLLYESGDQWKEVNMKKRHEDQY
jgi:hypothetical protein